MTPAPISVERLREISELIRTQDNRITDSPIFIVQQKRRIYGIEDGYSNDYVWIDGESTCTDEEKAARDAERAEDGLPPAEYRQCGYIDIWEFVTACFTEQGCKDYLARDGHNLKEPRIYAAGSYRNQEYRDVRNHLLALPALLQQLAELQAKTACTLGVGDGSGQLFVHGDYESIKAAQGIIDKLAEREAEVERLREIASQINTDWIPANKKLAERANAAERARKEATWLLRKIDGLIPGEILGTQLCEELDAFLAANKTTGTAP